MKKFFVTLIGLGIITVSYLYPYKPQGTKRMKPKYVKSLDNKVNSTFRKLTKDKVIEDFVIYNEEREKLTRNYSKMNYDDDAFTIEPLAIVLHNTATDSMSSSQYTFNSVKSGQKYLIKYGKVSTSAHFIVDRKGEIYWKLPLDYMSRSVIGINEKIISIENVGKDKNKLTDAQVKSDAYIIDNLVKSVPTLKYTMAHFDAHESYCPMNKYVKTNKYPEYTPMKRKKWDPGRKFTNDVINLLKSKYGFKYKDKRYTFR